MRAVVTRRIASDHPCLAGHFPDNPVVPATLLLETIAAALAEALPGARVAAIAWAKFQKVLRPDTAFHVELEETAPRLVAFACRDEGGGLLAEGRLRLRP
ncbi:MAG: hypothetical protein KDG89_05930 [Geminicoccaceae bacterium]|nr:hypothetical protein [Geminicoccaceae bacterium]